MHVEFPRIERFDEGEDRNEGSGVGDLKGVELEGLGTKGEEFGEGTEGRVSSFVEEVQDEMMNGVEICSSSGCSFESEGGGETGDGSGNEEVFEVEPGGDGDGSVERRDGEMTKTVAGLGGPCERREVEEREDHLCDFSGSGEEH